jgi:hypothetical protein
MEEGVSKTIPLRRSRTMRAVAVRPGRGWTAGITGSVRVVLIPPRQLWLAGLGGTVLALRGLRAAWSYLVAEGETAEQSLRRSLDGAEAGS